MYPWEIFILLWKQEQLLLKYKCTHTPPEGNLLIWALTAGVSDHSSVWIAIGNLGGLKRSQESSLQRVPCLAGPAVAVAEVLDSPSSCHQPPAIVFLLFPLHRAGKCPSRVNTKPLFPGPRAARRDFGADGLCERCSCPLHTKPLIRARRWEGGELLYKQAFKINCFSSLQQELAFQPQDTMRACSDCICSGTCTAKGCLAGTGWSFLGEINWATKCFVLLGLESVTVLMEVTTTCLQPQTGCSHHIISLLLGICVVSCFSHQTPACHGLSLLVVSWSRW